MVKRTCLKCGKEFCAKPSLIARGGGKFCSRRCSYASRPTGEQAYHWKGHPPRKYYPEKQREYIDGLKSAIFEILGNACVKCGFTDKRALQVDHKNGGGTKKRKEKPGWKFLLEAVRENSSEFQILCANCNWIKRYENYEGVGKHESKDN